MTVAAGTLSVTNSLASGDVVEVQSGATLNLAGGSISADSVRIDAGGSLTGTGTIATTLENNGTMLSSSGGTVSVSGDVINNGTMRLTGGTSLSATGAFTNNGVLDLLTGAGGLPANLVNNGVVIDSSAVKPKTYDKTGNVFTITIESYTGHDYKLQRTNALNAATAWQDAGALQHGLTQADGTPKVLTFTDTLSATDAAGGKWFYHILITP
jgi:hypothetical protein